MMRRAVALAAVASAFRQRRSRAPPINSSTEEAVPANKPARPCRDRWPRRAGSKVPQTAGSGRGKWPYGRDGFKKPEGEKDVDG